MKKGVKMLRDAAPVSTSVAIRVGTEKRSTTFGPDEQAESYIVERGRPARLLPKACVNGMLIV